MDFTRAAAVTARRLILIAPLAVAVISGCSGSGGDSSPPTQPDPPPRVMPLSLDVQDRAVIKIRARSNGLVLLEETLTPLTAVDAPVRHIELLDGSAAVSSRFEAPQGWAVIDFAVHPSGDVSVAIASQRNVRLLRLDAQGRTAIDTQMQDAQVASDPFFDEGGVRDDTSMLTVYTRDTVRLAPLGEDLAVALRTGRNAVVAYRFHPATGAYSPVWRTLVEPGLSIFAVGITSGSFDAFGQLANRWKVLLDADSAGTIAIAVPSLRMDARVFARHAQYFGEPISATDGALVTQLSADGQRIGSTAIDTVRPAELYGLRIQADGVIATGRVFTEQRADGGGWDGWFARIEQAGARLAAYRAVDVDRGDVLFDAMSLGNGRYVAAGAAGYTENPTGASISEQCDPLLLVLGADGSVAKRIAFPAGPGQNQLLSLAARGDLWSVAGLVDGPGTHSGDGNPSAIRANGLVRPIEAMQ